MSAHLNSAFSRNGPLEACDALVTRVEQGQHKRRIGSKARVGKAGREAARRKRLRGGIANVEHFWK
jgi:hypothetical protein